MKDGRKTTVVDRRGFSEHATIDDYQNGRCRRWVVSLHSFESPAVHRWLMRAPSSVINVWRTRMSTMALVNLAAANLPQRIPAVVLVELMQIASRRFSDAVRPEYQRLFRLFAAHCCEQWQTRGWTEFRRAFPDLKRKVRELVDWVVGDGLARGLPDRNSTWASVRRQCDEWHVRLREARVRQHTARPNQQWESWLGDHELDGYAVRALTSSAALETEGLEMHHCVDQYDDPCVEGYYRIFAVLAPSGVRSTLCIEQKAGTRWVVQQMYGVCNEEVPPETAAIGKRIARLYSERARQHVESAQSVG